jgi:hypothetical protein
MPVNRDFNAGKVLVTSGGRWAPDLPLADVGAANYVTKTNWRRGQNYEFKREGWGDFVVNNLAPTTSQFTIAAGVKAVQIGEVRRANGSTVPGAVTDTGAIWAFDYDAGAWVQVGSGYMPAPDPRRWEIEGCASYGVFNNGIDLPFTYQVGDAASVPIYELRESGYGSVGTIKQYNGILVAADAVEIEADSLATVMNGSLPYQGITSPPTGDTWTNSALYSEALDDATWTKTGATVSADAATAPNGASTADKLAEDSSNGIHAADQAITIGAGKTCLVSWFVKAAERTTGKIRFGDLTLASVAVDIDFDLSAKTIVASASAGTPTIAGSGIIDKGNGWFYVYALVELDGVTTSTKLRLYLKNAGTTSYAGSAGSGLYAWGASLMQQGGLGPYLNTSGTPVSIGVNRIAYRVLWSNIGDPRDWASVIPASATATSTTLTLAYPVMSLEAGDSITIIGAGTSGGNLVTTVAAYTPGSTSLTMTDAAVTTIADTSVSKTTALSSIVGFFDIEDDGSAITKMETLQNRIVVYKTTSIFVGYYTGDVDEPFQFDPAYHGTRTPRFRHTLVNVSGDYHLFAGDRSFYQFKLGASYPVEMDETELSKVDGFYSRVVETDEQDVYAVDNGCTNEVFFVTKDEDGDYSTYAYDYRYDKCSFIDDGAVCAAVIHKPIGKNLSDDREVILAMAQKAGTVVLYGASNLQVSTYQRFGVDFDATLKWGLTDFGDGFNEKDLRSWCFIATRPDTVGSMTFTLYGYDYTSQPPTTLETKTILNHPPGRPGLVPLYYRKIYFQDQISTTQSIGFQVSGRIFDFGVVESRSITRISDA